MDDHLRPAPARAPLSRRTSGTSGTAVLTASTGTTASATATSTSSTTARVAATPPAPAGLGQAVEDALVLTDQVLGDFLAERTTHARSLDPACGALWSDLGALVGGKLIRPRLTIAAYLGLGGHDARAVAPVAAAQELLHTAMLAHDDLLDHDERRRGRPNVAGATRARLTARGVPARAVDEQALAAGLLAGDVALASAFRLVGRAPVPPAVRAELVELLATSIETTVHGELLDVTSALLAPHASQPLLVAALKTADYSCRLPLVSGAVLAGAPEVSERLGEVGDALGLAFQLVDDELGVFGDPRVTGKSTLSDLREGRRTELVRLAYRHADAAGLAVLDAHLGRADLDEAGAAAVRTVMIDSGALEQTRALAARSAELARELADASLPGPLAEYLGGVVDSLAGRGR